MILIPDGNYQIFNTVFQGQLADLLDGKPNGAIVGFNNSREPDSVWSLYNTGYMGNQFTLQNEAPTANGAFAGVPDEVGVGVQLQGSPDPVIWTAIPTCIPEQLMLLAPISRRMEIPSGLVWTLDSDANGTPISLQFMGFSGDDDGKVYSRASTSQAWNFIPFR